MRRTLLAIVLLLFPTVALAQPAEVNRILRTIDFEERRLGNAEDLPMHWVKAEGNNLPHYVNGHLTTDRHRSGDTSFQFDLNGGGLIYRYEPGQLKVQPGAHYRVEAWVQTTVLAHARSRVTTYLVDEDGHILPTSIHHSELYAATAEDEPWKRLVVELAADAPHATWLIVELELLQPVQFAGNTLGDRTLYQQDIHGSAWFDDVTVSQVPEVKMTTDRPGNVFRRGEPLKLGVMVNDRFTDDLAAQLVIRDALHHVAYQRSGALDMTSAQTLGPGRKQLSLLLPALDPGWYEVSLVMNSKGKYVGEQSLSMVLLADNNPAVAPDPRFGLIATDLPFDGWGELPSILPIMSAGRVKLGIWSAAGNVEEYDSAGFDAMLVRLQELHITPTACLIDLPPSIAKKVRGPGWTALLKSKDEDWQPQLAYLIARHANHLDRWQLGADGSDAFVTDPGMRDVYTRVYKQFANLIQKPDLAMPWPAWYELDGNLPATVALSVPSSVLPAQLPLYMQDMRSNDGHNLSLSLQLLDRERYGREAQIRDLAQRVTFALAADAQRIDIPLPFTVHREGNDVVNDPQEMLMIVRTLIGTLSGATFKGKVPIADNVEAFLFDRNGQGIMILWDRGSSSGMRELAISLGDHPVRLDLWGNATPLLSPTENQKNGQVKLTLGSMPVFLVDIDGPLAQLRASVGMDRPLLESSFQPHPRHIHFSNPYPTAISGNLKLTAPEGWTLLPLTFSFSLNPGETFDREVTIQFPYNSVAGAKTLNVEFLVQADRNSSMNVPITLNLGLSDVGMQTIALRDGNDIIVQQIIQNYGDRPIDYTAFAVYPDQPRQERLVTGLGAGRTTIKRYRFPDVKIIPGAKLRAGVKELSGTRILNDEVPVP